MEDKEDNAVSFGLQWISPNEEEQKSQMKDLQDNWVEIVSNDSRWVICFLKRQSMVKDILSRGYTLR